MAPGQYCGFNSIGVRLFLQISSGNGQIYATGGGVLDRQDIDTAGHGGRSPTPSYIGGGIQQAQFTVAPGNGGFNFFTGGELRYEGMRIENGTHLVGLFIHQQQERTTRTLVL